MKKSTGLLICIFANTVMHFIHPKENAFFIVVYICIVGYFIVKLLEEKL